MTRGYLQREGLRKWYTGFIVNTNMGFSSTDAVSMY